MKRNYISIVLTCLFIFLIHCVVAQDMDTRISLDGNGRQLVEVLKDIQERYKVRFAFVNNDLPAKTVSIQIYDRPLKEALDILLDGTGIDYVVTNGMVIIRPGSLRPTASSTARLNDTQRSVVRTSTVVTKIEETKEATTVEVVKAHKQQQNSAYAPVELPSETITDTISYRHVHEYSRREEESVTKKIDTIQMAASQAPVKGAGDTTDVWSQPEDAVIETLNDLKPAQSHHAIADLGLLPPISTLGASAKEKHVHLGTYIVAGSTKSLSGMALGLVGTHQRSFMKGAQIAGVYNLVGEKAHGVQLSVGLNASGTGLKGLQLGGCNIAKHHLRGAQLALLNVAGADVQGTQIGALNIVNDLAGGQISGGVNVASEIRGFQLGAINVAKHVKGVQIGLINVADSISGISLGLINIVRHGGYHALEIFTADDLHFNLVYKMGVPKLHTIMAAGLQMLDDTRWGLGMGLGAEWSDTRLRVNTDLICYYVVEQSYKNFPVGLFNNDLNLLNKLRLLLTYRTNGRSAIFAGPVANVLVSRFIDGGDKGSGIIREPLFNKTTDKTNVKMWVGFNAGVRIHLGN